ncbi:hypothetical protein CLG96_01910 [Sphingomonas oleivorans]|uniref:Nuclease n=1 Tax=Sphingomonas oleivorans TaxID=1735121 RepID=A0A2T5G1C8_9SPHN|nr:hypothetical protein [Sphingomonas oleivorans]PTQ12921.1 hypothetical protein CLG96_01910 [Sphingomonas oleivorans]
MIALALAAIIVPAGQTFAGPVVRIHDADGPYTVATAQGVVKVRLQGVGAIEADGTCKTNQPCGDRDPGVALRTVQRIALGKRLTCVATGRSYGRTVAWCELPSGEPLSCAVIASGAGVRWDRYWPRGRRCI